ncbi:pectate lyase [Sphingomonas sp.]|uniref:pectate lyase n=1 Tax=Sphingomonas sp. TaxID=28214 RepID=UPI002DD62147|nr:pectate lyase [Sphingomonas sp.]
MTPLDKKGAATPLRLLLAVAALVAAAGTAAAGVIGRMTPAEPVTEARIAALPVRERAAWTTYLARSRAAMAANKAALTAERRAARDWPAAGPPHGSAASMPLDHAPDWYAGDAARRIADNIVSFQTPAGGWGKNQDRSGPPRRPGESLVPIERLPANAREDSRANDAGWRYVGTIDNGATLTELRFLARVQHALPGSAGAGYRAAFERGVGYLLAAEFPGGGWPQVYPLQGGYHDAITFNDGAVGDTALLLLEVGRGQGDFAFVPAALAAQAAQAAARATALIVATQVRVDGRPTLWGQQHDALTRAPVGARNFEPASLSTAESVDLIDYLMAQPERTPAITAAVNDGVIWLRGHALADVAWGADGHGGRRLIASPGAPPLWARLYAIDTGQPVFGDRDRSIHDDVNELSLERRNGYSWFTTTPTKLFARHARWFAGGAAPKGD